MASQKIADFFAQIGIKVDQKSLDRLGKSLDNIERGLHNMEAGAKKSAKQASALVNQNKSLNKAISDGNKVLNKRASVVRKVQAANSKANRASTEAMYAKLFGGSPTTPKRWAGANSKNSRAWQRNFKESVGRLTAGSSSMTSKARSAQQSMYDSLFGATKSNYSGLDSSHAAAMREDMRRTRSAQNIARIQENIAKREAQMAQRTAAIREAGAKRAAAIITAAEIRARAMSSRMGGGGAGRPSGRGMFGGASVGGAVGAASSNMASLLPGFGAGYAAVNFNRIGQELTSLQNALLAVSGSQEQAANNMAFLNSVGAEMGKTVRGLGPEFVKLSASIQGTALGGQEQDIFRSFMKYGTVMGLDEEAMKGSFRAVSQMVSKQQVYAEELRGQLAERLPAAVRIAAEVMTGGDTKALNKMMEAGQLDPNELLPKMAAYMDKLAESNGAYGKALGSSIVAQGRMNYEFEKFVGIFSKNGGEAGFSKIFNTFATFFRENPALAEGLGKAWEKFGKIIDRTVIGVDNLLDGFSMLSQYFKMSESDMALLSATALILATRFGRIAAAAGILFLILEDISVGMKGGDSYTKDFMDFLDANAWAEVAVKAAAFAASLALVAGSIGKIGRGLVAIGGVGGAVGGGSIVSTILSIITKHPIMAALVAATIALNTASNVYSEKADKHLQGVIERTDPNTAADLKRLSAGKVEIKDIARANPDFYRDFPSGKLPGINQPMMMVDKISIEVASNTSDPLKVADLVMVKIKEFVNQSAANLPTPD